MPATGTLCQTMPSEANSSGVMPSVQNTRSKLFEMPELCRNTENFGKRGLEDIEMLCTCGPRKQEKKSRERELCQKRSSEESVLRQSVDENNAVECGTKGTDVIPVPIVQGRERL